MRCKDVVTTLEEMGTNAPPQSITEHLSGCPACADNFKDLRLLRAGFRTLAEDRAPDASFGFASRVMRRLDDMVDSGRGAAEFLERAGRRFVLATLLLAMSMLLALVLPSSGPVRGPSNDEAYLSPPEARGQSYSFLLTEGSADSPDGMPVSLTNGSAQKQ